jgi:RNA polymerase sigma-70 factor (ECF subfamily)
LHSAAGRLNNDGTGSGKKTGLGCHLFRFLPLLQIGATMASPVHDRGAELERFRAYLNVLARLGLDPRLRGKVDLSGVVQETLLEAHVQWQRFQSVAEAARPAYLRKALANNLKDAIARLQTARRDVGRELSLDEAVEASSARLGAWLASDEDSPSEQAGLQENQLRLARALEQLPEERRTAVELHSLQGLTLQETACLMGKTKAAVAQLVHRGIKDLHDLLDHE